ncbi:MAG: mandelate racemase/muconate lactonizing enzyme family protein [Planctomycetes bacterium]|jgi:L-alanine-DL-glutamate epimerase-like enolase superfamily enzyme|nr:mandelate racemase/muconate lactonizing enzyme family protein [Planctomycetota bacterium]
MRLNRRSFLQTAVGVSCCAAAPGHAGDRSAKPTLAQLDQAAGAPVLKAELFTSPVRIKSIELLTDKKNHFVRTRSADGAEGIALTNGRAKYLHPILKQLVIPYFVGKDARQLDALLDGVYVHNSNYKLSGVGFWCCVAWVEFSILDLLGKIARKPVGDLLGEVIRREVPIYVASGNRDTTPEQEVAILAQHIERTGAKAVKFKVGGRMSNNADSMPGRTEGMARLVRKALGDKVTIYADANGSYDAPKGIEIGKLLQDNGINMFEEPCPFDWLEETKEVADALEIPVAGGEQETSLRRFRWMIHNNAVQIAQPDLHYNGGFIRAARIARMAAQAGMTIVPHMSGEGTGCIDVLEFASFIPNMGPFQEYKGDIEQIGAWYDPPLRLKDGAINVPTGPGLGIVADLLRNAKPV